MTFDEWMATTHPGSDRLERIAMHAAWNAALAQRPEARTALNPRAAWPFPQDRGELVAFQQRAVDIAVKRQKGYAERRHGDVLNKECADELVELCRAFMNHGGQS